MFLGISAEGINREIASTIECANLCRYSTGQTLAIPETAVYKLATLIPAQNEQSLRGGSLLGSTEEAAAEKPIPSWESIAAGILPSLRYLVSRELSRDSQSKMGLIKEGSEPTPDSHVDERVDFAVNAYLKTDFYCQICDAELSNSYYRCEGCLRLLGRDFNICAECYVAENFRQNVKMRYEKEEPIRWTTDRHHVADLYKKCTGELTNDVMKEESINDQVKLCEECSKGIAEECVCHQKFTKRLRFYSRKCLREMVSRCEKWVGTDEILFDKETEWRLNERVMPIGKRKELPIAYYQGK